MDAPDKNEKRMLRGIVLEVPMWTRNVLSRMLQEAAVLRRLEAVKMRTMPVDFGHYLGCFVTP